MDAPDHGNKLTNANNDGKLNTDDDEQNVDDDREPMNRTALEADINKNVDSELKLPKANTHCELNGLFFGCSSTSFGKLRQTVSQLELSDLKQTTSDNEMETDLQGKNTTNDHRKLYSSNSNVSSLLDNESRIGLDSGSSPPSLFPFQSFQNTQDNQQGNSGSSGNNNSHNEGNEANDQTQRIREPSYMLPGTNLFINHNSIIFK